MRALVLGDVLAMLLQDVYLHGPALGEACVADVAFVGPLTWDTDDNSDPPPRGFTLKPLVLPKGHPGLKAFLSPPGLPLQLLSRTFNPQLGPGP